MKDIKTKKVYKPKTKWEADTIKALNNADEIDSYEGENYKGLLTVLVILMVAFLIWGGIRDTEALANGLIH